MKDTKEASKEMHKTLLEDKELYVLNTNLMHYITMCSVSCVVDFREKTVMRNFNDTEKRTIANFRAAIEFRRSQIVSYYEKIYPCLIVSAS